MTVAHVDESVIDFFGEFEGLKERLKNKSYLHFRESLLRPSIPESVFQSKEPISLMQVDVDYYTDKLCPIFSDRLPFKNNGNTEFPVLRMFGTTESGASANVHVHGFFPYFYLQAPLGHRDTRCIMEALENELKNSVHSIKTNVLAVENVTKQSLVGYSVDGATNNFFKVTLALPKLVSTARGIIERGLIVNGVRFPSTSYESNLPYALRFTIDHDIVGGSWVEFPNYFRREKHGTTMIKRSNCTVELDVFYSDVVAHSPDSGSEKAMSIPPLRFLSFDIECMKVDGKGFPRAEEDPVIQIALVLESCQDVDSQKRFILTLDKTSAIAGSTVLSFGSESDLLLTFAELMQTIDCDLLMGYNIVNFDLPYILNRMRVLKLPREAFCLGRITDDMCTVKATVFQSKGLGKHDTNEINITGRVQFDLLTAIQRDYKLRSYSLNNVSAHFLNEQKEDVHYSLIGELQRGDSNTRRRIATYCIKDAILPLRLFHKLMFLFNYVELARVTGVPVSFMLTRGQQIRVITKLYSKTKQTDFVIPVQQRRMVDDGVAYEGATVLEPKKGYYLTPIATLDFASLYPSIMIAHNLCYSTVVDLDSKRRLDNFNRSEDYQVTPTNDVFVRTNVRRGLLPLVLEDLLSARKKAKKDMASTSDEFMKQVLNGRQLALKVTANSVYGTTGAQVGMLACMEISRSVTGFGRQMIETTRQMVLDKYNKANGFPYDAEVIYGDTDSVMVKFGTDNLQEAMKWGEEAASYVSTAFVKPIKLEFEKVYFPFLLMNKKRYAALMWTSPDKFDKLDAKGIETVRRDNCALVQQTVDKCLRLMMIEKDVPSAVTHAKSIISELLQGKVDVSKLVISKSLGKGASSEAYSAKQAHVELAEKLRKRDPASAPSVGDRVAYVIIQGAKNAPAYERAEDPLYCVEHNIPVDAMYYLENQLKKPLCRIFEGALADPERELFSGEHTSKVTVRSISDTSAMSKFVTKSVCCMNCKKPINVQVKDAADPPPFCKACGDDPIKVGKLVRKNVKDLRNKEKEFAQLWRECQRCQGSLHDEVLCTSRDCPIFYRRIRVRQDFEMAQKEFNKIKLDW